MYMARLLASVSSAFRDFASEPARRAADTPGVNSLQRSSTALITMRSKNRSAGCAIAAAGSSASAAARHPIHRDAGLALLRVLFMRLLTHGLRRPSHDQA